MPFAPGWVSLTRRNLEDHAMSDFAHARICIRHASGSVEIQAPAGEVTWLDLSGLHALPIAAGKEGRRKRRFLTSLLFFGCSTAFAAYVGFVSSNHLFSAASRAEASALEQPGQQQALLPGLAMPSTIQVPRAVPAPVPEPMPHPAAHDADPFGLRLK